MRFHVNFFNKISWWFSYFYNFFNFFVADDKRHWKEKCPTFNYVVEKMAGYFDMDVQATRFNWYRDSSEWKPFHHDAAAMKEKFARTQNFTLAVSFGAEREAAFEHAKVC